MRVLQVVGARPNFMKVAPTMKAMEKRAGCCSQVLVHTGQHYDRRMSKTFFDDLGMPRPDIDLEVGAGTHAEQTGRAMVEFEKVCVAETPDLGDFRKLSYHASRPDQNVPFGQRRIALQPGLHFPHRRFGEGDAFLLDLAV